MQGQIYVFKKKRLLGNRSCGLEIAAISSILQVCSAGLRYSGLQRKCLSMSHSALKKHMARSRDTDNSLEYQKHPHHIEQKIYGCVWELVSIFSVCPCQGLSAGSLYLQGSQQLLPVLKLKQFMIEQNYGTEKV